MRAFLSRLPLWAAALWWGSLTTIGFIVVPLLFIHLPTPADAGRMAAKLFTAQTWVSVVCALLLLLASRPREDGASTPLFAARLPIAAGLLLALLVEFAIAPRIVARENPMLWHNLGTVLYFLQWVCAGVVFWRLTKDRS